MSFLTDYFGIAYSGSEQAVCCPFPHKTSIGLEYFESHPSAHVNAMEGVFHCKSCGRGFSEVTFMEKILGCSNIFAHKLKNCFNTAEDKLTWDAETLTSASQEKALSLGISQEVIDELCLKTPIGCDGAISFPVFMYGHLVDIRTYNPDHKPKVRSRAGCPAGLIIPYDTWIESPTNKVTVLCAGEKDMAVARTHGLNAITFTGGETITPQLLNAFKDRIVAICYDNDDAGKTGAKRVAKILRPYAAKVKVVTGFHEVCKENKEDITDFFVKYGKTKEDLVQYIKDTPEYVPTEEELEAERPPLVTLLEATNPKYLNRPLRSNIQVVAVSDASFITPSSFTCEKFKVSGNNDTMMPGDIKDWELNEQTAQDVLHLIDNNFTEETIKKNMKTLVKIPPKESYIKIKTYTKKTVYKAYVTDLFETNTDDMRPMEFNAYSIGNKLESGKKYEVTYKLIPHPYKGQQLTMVILDVQQANDSISNFEITPEVINQLKQFQEIEGTVEERINILTEKVKGLLGYDGNNTLIQAIDLSYHTVLEFNFGTFKNVRGYLDTFIVGESRVGKSSTSDALRKTYGLGVFTSLAGNSATIPGLIGGSNKTQNGFQTRAGLIPQNHKGLIIFEEFGKSNANITKELTDIRSSNEVRITRVAGTITMPANVRMITLTNVKATDGTIKPIASYPNGIEIVTELIGTAEDIARYDLLVVLSDRGNTQVNPFWEPETPMSKEAYQARVRWVWSRTPEQVLISRDVGMYLIEQANRLNQIYDCHIKIFGTEAWKKLARLAIAVAGYLVSTDDTYNNIVVTREHVDFAVNYFIRLYDNPTFKLKEYVQHEKQYTTIDEDGVANLQDIYNKTPSLVLQLEQVSSCSKQMLSAATGLSQDELNKALNRLSKGLFIRFNNHNIYPTERFRLGLSQLNRNIHVERIGEHAN